MPLGTDRMSQRGMVREYVANWTRAEEDAGSVNSLVIAVTMNAVVGRFVTNALAERWVQYVNEVGGRSLLEAVEGDPLAFVENAGYLAALQAELDSFADQIFDALTSAGIVVENGGDDTPISDWLSEMARKQVDDNGNKRTDQP